MKKYLMALDQGTTSSRCILFDRTGSPIGSAQKEFPQIYPQEGWVEQDPLAIRSTQFSVVTEALLQAGATWEDIAGIGITNQRETTVVWDRKTGVPVYNAIVWQCRRTAGYCDRLRADGMTETIREKTGLLIDPYFSATKLRWILNEVPGVRARAERGELCFGTVDSWLIWNLTGGKVHATDVSNASRTMLFNIRTLQWDRELCALFDIPMQMLPEVRPSSGIFGMTDVDVIGASVPIGGVAGDQQAALFGQCCFTPGSLKNTYGTGAFLLMNTGEEPCITKDGLLTTVAWSVGGKVNYALEGSVFVCGAAIQWLRDGMHLIGSAAESEHCARKVPDSGGVYVVPAFSGLGAPWWDPYAGGTIIGITRATTANHIIRATVESMAYQTYDIVKLMEHSTGMTVDTLRVDGGACANNLLLEFQASILNAVVERPASVETTALGAAYLCGLAVGMYGDTDDILANRRSVTKFLPQMEQAEREGKIRRWHDAVQRTLKWNK